MIALPASNSFRRSEGYEFPAGRGRCAQGALYESKTIRIRVLSKLVALRSTLRRFHRLVYCNSPLV